MTTAEALRAAEGTAMLPDRVWTALSTVLDPELDEPITDLGFVRSHAVDGADVEVHLRLPTSFCSPSFAYLMAADAHDALTALPDVGRVVVVLDDHHDSDKINDGLAASAGYLGTFTHEAEESLDELRLVFRRKAHTAAVERAVGVLTATTGVHPDALPGVRLRDLVPGREKDALLKRRADLGLPTADDAYVLVDELGHRFPADQVPLRLRFARTTRISIDGNAHFCRGLLRTRYADAGADQQPRAQDPGPELFQITTRRPDAEVTNAEREA
ncbi:MAG TPA: iron-sulfur cluster assembly protein [Friedmanniella sp.]